MNIRPATLSDKDEVLSILDEFRADCMEQVTGAPSQSDTARTGGKAVYESLLLRDDYCALVLVDQDSKIVGIITGYLCPMLRSGTVRAEVEEFFINKDNRGGGNANLLMDAFFEWCKQKGVRKVNLESENELLRAHSFYKKYGFETKAQRFIKKLNA